MACLAIMLAVFWAERLAGSIYVDELLAEQTTPIQSHWRMLGADGFISDGLAKAASQQIAEAREQEATEAEALALVRPEIDGPVDQILYSSFTTILDEASGKLGVLFAHPLSEFTAPFALPPLGRVWVRLHALAGSRDLAAVVESFWRLIAEFIWLVHHVASPPLLSVLWLVAQAKERCSRARGRRCSRAVPLRSLPPPSRIRRGAPHLRPTVEGARLWTHSARSPPLARVGLGAANGIDRRNRQVR